MPTAFAPFEARVRAILSEHPEMPATVIAERVDWTGSITWFRVNVRRLRPDYRRPNPADRRVCQAGKAAQCDLRFPPKRIPLEDGSRVLFPVLVIVAAHSRFITARMSFVLALIERTIPRFAICSQSMNCALKSAGKG